MTLSLLPPPAASATDRTGHPRPASRAPSSWARTREAGLDWVLLGAVTALLTSGVVLVWSATSAREALTGATRGPSSPDSWSTSPWAWP